MNTNNLATMQANIPACSEEAHLCDLYPSMGKTRFVSEFMSPRYSRTLSAKAECAYKWLLAKDLNREKVPFTDVDDWNPQLVDMKKKGLPRYPFVQSIDGVAYLVFLTPKFNLWSKTKRLLLRLPNEIGPYYVLPDMVIQWAPIYKVKWRYGFDIQLTSVNMERLHSGEVEFSIDRAGEDLRYRYTYHVNGKLQDPIRFYYFCTNTQNAQDRFKHEVELFLRKKIEEAYKENYNSAVFSLSGTIDLQKVGYGVDTKFELYYKSN